MRSRSVRARVVTGFQDTFSDEVQARRAMFDTVQKVYESYGFIPLETPALEYVDVLGKFLPESNTPAGGIFAMEYEEEWIALRYDLTAPLSRVVAMYDQLPLPFRRYQVGTTWRRELALEPGRFQEFYQMDFDSVGVPGVVADAEACIIMAETLEALGVKKGEYIVRANHRKILAGLIEKIGIGRPQPGMEWSEKELIVLRAIDKLDRLGLDGVLDLLGIGRRDASGSFTTGAGLNENQIEVVRDYLSVSTASRRRYCKELESFLSSSEIGMVGVNEMVEMDRFLSDADVSEDRVEFDPTVIRGLAYYTGPVFEATLTMEITDENGLKRRFGSVFGGGRYDSLVERFTGKRVPATGASIGVDRLLAALKLLNRIKVEAATAPVLVGVVRPEQVSESHAIAVRLRRGGINTELYLGGKDLQGQLKYADVAGKSVVVLRGDREKANGTVSLKDLRLGRELAGDVTGRNLWLQKLPGQVTVPESSLLDGVRQILARYGMTGGTPEQ